MAKGDYLFPKEVIQRFFALYRTMQADEAIEILKKEFPEVAKADKPLKYWTQIANRNGIRKKPLPKPAQMALPVEEITPTTPEVPIPEYIVFGSTKLPLDAIRYYRDEVMRCERSRGEIVQSVRERFPSIAHIPDTTIPNFFTLRFGSCNRMALSKIGEDELNHQLQMQSRNQLVLELHAQKWRDSAIVEKAAELFPNLEPISAPEVKTIVDHRAVTARARAARKTRKEVSQEPREPKEPRKITAHSVKLLGPNMHYDADLTPEQAKDLLKTLLEL